ncbi:MAG: hypothetical protein CL693_10735 [Cellvibrionaceae bacterium]|nr:hypothetical protein [Cellvibrionaceae bacterium]|tara:strand:- start:9557 stop:10225 length:669 start_codon:yes stop_codon:yes gene_type:complete
MPFQVIEQGRRVETPWKSLFPPRQVTALNKSQASRAISSQPDLKHSQGDGGLSHCASGSLAEYQQQAVPASEHRPVFRADQIMSFPLVSLALNASLQDALLLFQQRRIRHIPILNERNQPLGILSDRDVWRATSDLGEKTSLTAKVGSFVSLERAQVSEIMQPHLLAATADTNLRELTRVMVEHRVGSILIIDEASGAAAGIITRSDVLSAVSNQVPVEMWV